MRNRVNVQTIERGKLFSILALFTMSLIIILLGAAFSIFSLMKGVAFTVLNSRIHGAVFGMVVLFLGIRYFFSVRKLKAEVYKTESKFSWSNFKKEKQR